MRKDFKFLFWSTSALYAVLVFLKSVNFKGWSNFFLEPLLFSVLWFFLVTGFDLILLKFIPQLHEALFYEAPRSKSLPQRTPEAVFKENAVPPAEKTTSAPKRSGVGEKKDFITSPLTPPSPPASVSPPPTPSGQGKISNYQAKKDEAETELEKVVLEYDDKALARATSSFLKKD